MKWYQDDKGNTSALRLIAVPSAAVGFVMTFGGLAGMWFEKSASSTAMITGAGMVATALSVKALQKKSENNGA